MGVISVDAAKELEGWWKDSLPVSRNWMSGDLVDPIMCSRRIAQLFLLVLGFNCTHWHWRHRVISVLLPTMLL